MEVSTGVISFSMFKYTATFNIGSLDLDYILRWGPQPCHAGNSTNNIIKTSSQNVWATKYVLVMVYLPYHCEGNV